MDIVNENLDKIGFKQYTNDYNFGVIPPNKIILHHTYKPDEKTWNGKHSIAGLKKYYEGKGWSAAPHIFIAPDGIWLFTPLNRVGIHAGVGNAGYYDKVRRKTINGFYGHLGNGNWRYQLKECSIGVEMVGFFDSERPSGKVLDQTLFVVKTLMERLKLKHDSLSFHRDWYGANKTCPGAAVTKEWIYKKLEEYGKPKKVSTTIPKYFKENFVWDPDKPNTHEETLRLLYKYHKIFGDKS